MVLLGLYGQTLSDVIFIVILQLEAENLQISPRSPLVSTTLVENGWICGMSFGSCIDGGVWVWNEGTTM